MPILDANLFSRFFAKSARGVIVQPCQPPIITAIELDWTDPETNGTLTITFNIPINPPQAEMYEFSPVNTVVFGEELYANFTVNSIISQGPTTWKIEGEWFAFDSSGLADGLLYQPSLNENLAYVSTLGCPNLEDSFNPASP